MKRARAILTAMSAEPPSTQAWAVLLIAVSAAFVAIFTASSVSVAFSAIATDLGIGVHRLHWMITLYMMVFTAFIPLSGWLGDRFGPRPILLSSFVVFFLGCIVATWATRWDVLLIARGMQAIGASSIMPASVIMLTQTFGPHERGRAFGIWTLGTITAPSLGPTLGGFIVQHLGWRMLFGVTMLITGIVWIMAYVLMPKRPAHTHALPIGRFRIASLMSFVFAIELLVLLVAHMTPEAQHDGLLPIPWPYVALASALAFGAFVRFEQRARHPLFPRALIHNATVRIALCLGAVRALGLFGPTFLLPLMLQQVMGKSAQQVGLIMSTTAVMLACTSPFVGKSVDRFGARGPAMVGVGCVVVGLLAYGNVQPDTPMWMIIWPQLVRGVGLAFLINTVSVTVVNHSAHHESGRSGSLLSLTNQLAGALSVAALNTAITPALFTLEKLNVPLLGSPIATGAFGHAFVIAGIVCALGYLPALMLPKKIHSPMAS